MTTTQVSVKSKDHTKVEVLVRDGRCCCCTAAQDPNQ
jgi:hypothetical protein